jgi:hypothetical protein
MHVRHPSDHTDGAEHSEGRGDYLLMEGWRSGRAEEGGDRWICGVVERWCGGVSVGWLLDSMREEGVAPLRRWLLLGGGSSFPYRHPHSFELVHYIKLPCLQHMPSCIHWWLDSKWKLSCIKWQTAVSNCSCNCQVNCQHSPGCCNGVDTNCCCDTSLP